MALWAIGEIVIMPPAPPSRRPSPKVSAIEPAIITVIAGRRPPFDNLLWPPYRRVSIKTPRSTILVDTCSAIKRKELPLTSAPGRAAISPGELDAGELRAPRSAGLDGVGQPGLLTETRAKMARCLDAVLLGRRGGDGGGGSRPRLALNRNAALAWLARVFVAAVIKTG